MYEPAFYSTVVQDWGTNYLIAQELGPKAFCLVDLGHHAPNVNIEMIVARLIQFGKLGGFHFNDSKYGDDDLDAGSIDPYRLFLVFNELVDAEDRGAPGFQPAHMLDQSHNVTDPIESLMVSAMEVQRAYAQALLVDRAVLEGCQEANDALMATLTLKAAFRTDVEPILALARLEKGGGDRPGRGLPRQPATAPRSPSGGRRWRAWAAGSSEQPPQATAALRHALRGEDQHLACQRHPDRRDPGPHQPAGQRRIPDVMRHVVEAVLGKVRSRAPTRHQ